MGTVILHAVISLVMIGLAIWIFPIVLPMVTDNAIAGLALVLLVIVPIGVIAFTVAYWREWKALRPTKEQHDTADRGD